MAKDEFTNVRKILHQDDLKLFADLMVSEAIDNVILIYHNKKLGTVDFATTSEEWSTIFGEMAMVNTLMKSEWLAPDNAIREEQ